MHAETYLREVESICVQLDAEEIELMATALSKVEGRVYVVGLGGSLANAIHMAADLRKLCDLDAHAPNIAEMSAWMNDSGDEQAFSGLIRNAGENDALFVLSVGGGTTKVSTGIYNAVAEFTERDLPIFGIVGPNGGVTAELGDYVIRIPAPKDRQTPHTEAFQAVLWHLLVSHPLLQRSATKW